MTGKTDVTRLLQRVAPVPAMARDSRARDEIGRLSQGTVLAAAFAQRRAGSGGGDPMAACCHDRHLVRAVRTGVAMAAPAGLST